MGIITLSNAWRDGYYEDGGGWAPCHSSCKTCSNNTTWDICEDFMLKNSTTSLWEFWPDGEYYDFTKKLWRSWDGVWDGQWKYQSFCLTCSSGQSLDLDTLTCVGSCDTSQELLEGFQLSISRAWRSLDYYIDPDSQEILELGTREYPYRTVKSVTSEILTYLSHKDVDITIYTKDVYIQDKSFQIVNITHITITTHPDLAALGQKALIIPTEFEQTGVSKKARFHLLLNTSLPLGDAIANGNFTEDEESKAASNIYNIIIRSAITIHSVDLYREDIDYNNGVKFLLGVYLQEKTANFSEYF